MNINRYPRPNLVRNDWTNLNGEWDFAFDNNYKISNVSFDKKINVPFAYQSELSNINSKENHDIVWYKKEFRYEKNNKRVILHFGAVDYEADVYLNGQYLGNHINGSINFNFEITDLIKEENELIVRVCDPTFEESITRGKQYWKENSEAIWYTRTTGIWQTVWLEEVSDSFVSNIKFTPDLDTSSIKYEIDVDGKANYMSVEIFKDGELLVNDKYEVIENHVNRSVNLLDSHIFRYCYHSDGWTWTPENPNLFDVKIKVYQDEEVLDEVKSYFGMRKVHMEKGQFHLNNKPYMMRLVLDQGYWPQSLLTAPGDDAFAFDINASKKMGFNGCRKHQKTEDPNFLYDCDRLGYIVWSEVPSAPLFNEKVVTRMTNEYMDMVKRDFNHPSICVWVLINESWGTPKIHLDKQQQAFSQGLYHTIKALDPTRLAISNDGWAQTITDICAIHNYNHGQKSEVKKYDKFVKDLSTTDNILLSQPASFPIYANGFKHNYETPIMITEFGGIAYVTNGSEEESWGYTSAKTEEEFLEDLSRIMDAIYESNGLHGFCYTQLTDVEQEVNGLLNYDRSEKISLEKISKIITNNK